MITVLASTLLILGALFALIAAIGVARMPDIYCRMHAATKAGAFGVSLILLALCIAMPSIRVFIESILIILFFYLYQLLFFDHQVKFQVIWVIHLNQILL